MISKKIIFIGPPGTGKTSLRKVFFEGESSKKILNFSLKPTFGEESLVLNLSEMIGIFDLAGQENQVWLQVSEDSILIDARIIIIVVDCTDTFENNIEFIKRVIEIRDEVVQECLIYILVHKIDLIGEAEIYDIKYLMHDRLYYNNQINVAYTSIHKDYFTYTFSVFIDLLKKCIQRNIATEKTEINFIYNTIFFLYHVNQSNLISKDELHYQLNIPEADFKKIEEFLLNNKLIRIKELGKDFLYRLTEKGTSNIERLCQNFSMENLRLIENSRTPLRSIEKDQDLRFLGFFMAAKSGISLVNAEIEDGYFERFLQSKENDSTIDIGMISSLITALEMFSSELNIKDIPGFKLKGSNIMIQSFNYEKVTISLVVDSDTNIKAISGRISDWFDNFLDRHSEIIDKAINTGTVTKMKNLALEGRQWLRELNVRYNSFVNNHEIFDINETKSLYAILDKIPLVSISDGEGSIVKKLKGELLRASIEEDSASLRDLSKRIKSL